jgi:sulfite reductase (NADPH) hemoprotein beta-component
VLPQAYQFHGIVKSNLKLAMQGINRAALDTLAACGDVNRNIIANPQVHDALVYQQVNDLANHISAHLKPKTSAYHEIWLDKKPVRGHVDVEPLYGATCVVPCARAKEA